MTVVDRLIPYYVWFIIGFGIVSVLLGVVNFGMIMFTLITVKGIYVPIYAVGIVAAAIIAFCIWLGWFFERHAIQNRITSHTNKRLNTEFDKLCGDVQQIKTLLEGRQ